MAETAQATPAEPPDDAQGPDVPTKDEHHGRVVAALVRQVKATRTDPTLRREADMMAFYLATTLLVALDLARDDAPPPLPEVILIIWGTTLGLAVAHWFALGLSAYLVKDPTLHHTPGQMLFSQVVMSVFLALLASAAVLLMSPYVRAELLSGRVAVALFVGALVVVESRARGDRVRRALGLGAVALGLALAVAIVKLVLH